MFFLKLFFRDEGHLYANCLFYILTINPKCHPFQFFNRGIRMYIPILRGIQNGRINLRKKSVLLLKKIFFLNLFSEMKVTEIARFIFWLFTLNDIFLNF